MSYQEQLQHPLWQRKRLEIMQRDGWKCRVCHRNDRQLHVHHANGYKNGKAPWEYPDEELWTLCAECHENKHHPKSLKIYLAGKIYAGDWRNDIFETRHCCGPNRAGAMNLDMLKDDEFWKYEMENAIFDVHTYVGPFFVACDHGCYHGDSTHGVGSGKAENCGSGDTINAAREMVLKNSSIQIQKCDLLFSWIESEDCYGTLAEIGYAYALRKPIFVAMNKPYPDLWFAFEMAFAKPKVWDDPKKALEEAVGLVFPVSK